MQDDRDLLLDDFKTLEFRLDHHNIPEVPQKRKATDKAFTYLLGISLLILAAFLTYSLYGSSLDRLIRGYDRCGNVCGKRNAPIDDVPCSGKNFEHKPYLKYLQDPEFEYSYTNRECAAHCHSPEYFIEGYSCFKNDSSKNYYQRVISDLNKSIPYIAGLSVLSIVVSILMLVLYRYATTATVVVSVIMALISFALLAVSYWIVFSSSLNQWNSRDDRETVLALAITFTVLSVVGTLMVIFLFKRIKLVTMLFKEAARAVFSMPHLLVEPILTLIGLFACLGLFIFTTALMVATSGSFTEVGVGYYDSTPSTFTTVTIFFNLFVCIWMVNFIIGCQHMVLSGAVSAWYFARDRVPIAPLYNSFYNLFVYHIGTVCFGSLVITAVQIIRALIRMLTRNRSAALFLDTFCCAPIQRFIQYLTKNAYIQTAMHGQPFYKSGKRAAKLLLANVTNVATLNSTGEFSLFMTKTVVVIVTVVVGSVIGKYADIEYFRYAIIISAIISFVVVTITFAAFQTAIDTLFICYCEDMILNDGATRPYFMSTNLMKFVEDSKAIAPKKA